MDYEQNGASSTIVKATSSTSKRCSQTQTKFKLIPKRRSVWGPAYVSSEQHLKSTRTEDALVTEGLPEEANGLEKTTETEAHSSLAKPYAFPFPVNRFPAKSGSRSRSNISATHGLQCTPGSSSCSLGLGTTFYKEGLPDAEWSTKLYIAHFHL